MKYTIPQTGQKVILTPELNAVQNFKAGDILTMGDPGKYKLYNVTDVTKTIDPKGNPEKSMYTINAVDNITGRTAHWDLKSNTQLPFFNPVTREGITKAGLTPAGMLGIAALVAGGIWVVRKAIQTSKQLKKEKELEAGIERARQIADRSDIRTTMPPRPSTLPTNVGFKLDGGSSKKELIDIMIEKQRAKMGLAPAGLNFSEDFSLLTHLDLGSFKTKIKDKIKTLKRDRKRYTI